MRSSRSSARPTTQPSIAWICPNRSAVGRKSAGRIGAAESLSRTSSSWRSGSTSSEIGTIGWACSSRPPCSSASRIRAAQESDARERDCPSRSGSASMMRSRPASLAATIARSASASSSVASAGRPGSIGAIPIEAVTRDSSPSGPTRALSRSALSSPSATARAERMSVRGSTTANSSEPMRPRKSVVRRRSWIVAAASPSSRSPAECPWTSLISRKLSRSMMQIAAGSS